MMCFSKVYFRMNIRSNWLLWNICMFLFVTLVLLNFVNGQRRSRRFAIKYGIISSTNVEAGSAIKSGISGGYRLKQFSDMRRRGYYPTPINEQLDENNPNEILDLFCNRIFKNNVTALFHFNVDRKSAASKDYIEGLASHLGLPILSWDPDYAGALENKQNRMVLQLAPTLYHQAKAMLEFMKLFNWTHFVIVSTTEDNHFDFIRALEVLVKKNNDVNILSEQFRYTILSKMVYESNEDDSDETEKMRMSHFLHKYNPKQNRIFLLHSVRAKNILDAASTVGLTKPEYMWIISTTSVGVFGSTASRSFPVGVVGVSYRSDNASYASAIYSKAVKVGIATWAGAISRIPQSRLILPKFTCNSSVPVGTWKYGREIYRRMKSVSNMKDDVLVGYDENGLSEFVELAVLNVQSAGSRKVWKQIGRWFPSVIPISRYRNKVELRLQIDGISWPGDKKVPPRGRPERRHFSIGTYQEEPYVMFADRNIKTGKCITPAVPCRVIYNETLHGNDSTHINGTVSKCCAGLSIDLLQILSVKMEFDYDLFEVADQTCGVKDTKTGEWNGLIRLLQEGGADMVMTSLQITPHRAEAVDFSVPYLETGTSIIVLVRKDKISATAILEPYNYPTWCLILVFSVHSIGASIFIFEWLSPIGLDQGRTPMREHSFSLFRSFWLIWAMLFGAAVSADNPRGVSSRFLGNVWALFALVFLASYTANLAAFMITKDTYYDLEGITDWRLNRPLQHQPPFKFATIPSSSTEENLRQNHPAMFKYMSQYNKASVKEAIVALKRGDIQAFIYDAMPLQYQVGIDDDCRLMLVGQAYAMSGYSIALPKGSTELREEVDKIILDLQEDGELDRLRKFWLSGPCHSKQRLGQSSNRLRELNFTSAFILLASGIVLGGFLLIFEHMYFRFGRKYLKKYDKCGCCALVSISMGKSLTFEQTIMDAIDFRKKHKCKNPICETQLWKVRHELDLALLKIEKLNRELRRERTKALPPIERIDSSDPLLGAERDGTNGNPIDKKKKEEEHESNDNISDGNEMKNTETSSDAIETSLDERDDSIDMASPLVCYNDGKMYEGVDTGQV